MECRCNKYLKKKDFLFRTKSTESRFNRQLNKESPQTIKTEIVKLESENTHQDFWP